MRTIYLLLFAGVCAFGQTTTVYLRDSGPYIGKYGTTASVQICNATNATPMRITTCLPTSSSTTLQPAAHGMNPGCGTSVTCYYNVVGVLSDGNSGTCPSSTVSGTIAANNAEGIRTVKWIDVNTLELYDLSGVSGTVHLGNPIAATGNYCSGIAPSDGNNANWGGPVTPYTIGNSLQGWLDGPTGDTMRKLALSTQNGLASTNGVFSTCSGGTCSLTVATAGYDPTAAKIPLQAGNQFTLFGTGTTFDSTVTGCAGSGTPQQPLPYTVASVSPTGWRSTPFACAGAVPQDLTNAKTICGPPAVPNDTFGGGTQSCTVVSQIAYHGNIQWDNYGTYESNYYLFDTGTNANGVPNFKYGIDGGSVNNSGMGAPQIYSPAAILFLVDRSNATLFRDIQYFYNEVDLMGGVSFPANELFNHGGNSIYQAANYNGEGGVSLIYEVYDPYASAAHHTQFLNKILNDINIPGKQCSKTGVEAANSPNMVGLVSSGTSQGAPTSTSIVLAAGTNGVVANEMILLGSDYAHAISVGAYGLVTGFSGGGGATPTVTVSAWTGTLPTAATYYAVVATATWTNVTAGQLATVTFTPGAIGGMAITSVMNIAVGDAVTGANGWMPIYANTDTDICKVKSVSAGSVTCYNGIGVNSSVVVGTPVMAWHFANLTSLVSSTSTTGGVGACGERWTLKHWYGSTGSAPAMYPADGGAAALAGDGQVAYAGNQAAAVTANRMLLDIVMAPSDTRAIQDLAYQESELFDFVLPHYMSYDGDGWAHSGVQYSAWVGEGLGLDAWIFARNFPTFPSLSTITTGPWLSQAKVKQYTLYPDFAGCGGGYGTIAMWGGASTIGNSCLGVNTIASGEDMVDPIFWGQPTSADAQYLNNWLTNIMGTSGSLFQMWGADYGMIAPLYVDPRIGSMDYQGQPLQYLFTNNNQAQAVALTGWGDGTTDPNVHAVNMVSRTAWNNRGGSHPNGAVLLHRASGYADEYDEFGVETHLYQMGGLLSVDTVNGWDQDYSIVGPADHFGPMSSTGAYEFNTFFNTPPYKSVGTKLLRWASANHGSWAAGYGDQSSQYAHVCADSALGYQAAWGVTTAVRCVTDFKKPAADHFVVEHDYAATSVAEPIQRAIHYPQNGQPGGVGIIDTPYQTGTTICVDSSGTSQPCSSLNAYRRIRSTEDGSGTPARQYGLLTQIYSPGTITVNWDCPGATNCSSGSTYPGGNGYTDRVTIAAGTSIGANANSLEDVIVHKVMNGLNDTTFSTAQLNGAGWTGAEACGSNSCMAYLGIRSQGTAAAVPQFTTTLSSSLSYQYLISGVAPGTYTVNVGSTQAYSGTVSAGDNTIEFTGGAGVVSVSSSSAARGSAIQGNAAAAGAVIIR